MSTSPFYILPTDEAFPNSPDVGDPDCVCSRCGQVIGIGDGLAIRAFDTDRNIEYRYHPACVGITILRDDEETSAT